MIAAALQWNMEMRHEFLAVRYPSDHFVGEQVGLDRRDTVTRNAFDLVKLLHQPEEIFSSPSARAAFSQPIRFGLLRPLTHSRCAFAKIAKVHAGEHDLPDLPAGRQPPDIGHGTGDAVAAALSPGHGDSAE